MTTNDVPSSPPRRLVRRRDDRKVAGVCAALGSYTDMDPVVYRVVLGVLAFFGGAGLLLYLVGWLFIPEVGTGRAHVDGVLRRGGGRVGWRTLLAVALLVIGVGFLVTDRRSPSGAILLVLAFVAFLLLRERNAAAPATPPRDALPPAEAGVAAMPPPPAGPPAPWSPLGFVTLGAALGAVLVGWLLDQADVLHATLLALLAIAFGIVLVGFSAGLWLRRARWLAGPGTLILAALVGAGVVSGVPLGEGTGDRAWFPIGAAQLNSPYRLAAGQAMLDLSRVGDLTGIGSLTATVGLGRLEVRLPDGVPVHIRSHAGAGRLELLGTRSDGLRVDRETTAGDPSATDRLELDLRVGAGELVVTRP